MSTQSQVDCGQLETCESLCCQDTLDLYQEKDPASLKNTRSSYGKRYRQLCADWYNTYTWLVLCRGQAYDGAANMSGYISGVAARIQRVEPSAIFVHCLAHSNNLCLKSVSRISVCVHESLDLVMGLGQLIRFSPKRSTLFEALQAEMTPGAPTLKPLCPTRWTVRTKAIDSVLRNYSVLLNELEIVQQSKDEYAMKAHAYGYLDTMGKFKAFLD